MTRSAVIVLSSVALLASSCSSDAEKSGRLDRICRDLSQSHLFAAARFDEAISDEERAAISGIQRQLFMVEFAAYLLTMQPCPPDEEIDGLEEAALALQNELRASKRI